MSVLCAMSVLSSCSGDDTPESAGKSASPSSTSTVEARNGCTADVELTGAVKKKWSGDAFSITENQSGPVQFRTVKGKFSLVVFGADDAFDALASLSTPKGGYTTQGGKVEVDDKNGGAEIDADATPSGAGKSVHITASFDC